ncbi:uncharacterized protein SCDLUD_000945 [Saccharomycodes ludwigii]|uniref:uncharacterized protein n=1 Tax=Saccharomycodes ludwigii TaxID=36035 RepID=UPI001E897A01|nr:hypothetical protein SCDLUD_000945 [Saccharomycodes ludwigii]KAH3903319.1 hypothetical protein SCDLUD_000945 [Saccharomycodes ludwigii]
MSNDRLPQLPTLLNPLINALFNCPNPKTSPLSKIFEKLKFQNFILLVPPFEQLLKYDTHSQIPIKLCEEFVSSHILVTSDDPNNNWYKTLNNKESNIRISDFNIILNNVRRIKILDVQYFPNFNDYFFADSHFLFLFIDICLVDNNNILNCLLPQNIQIVNNPLDSEEEETENGETLKFERFLALHQDVTNSLKSSLDFQLKELKHSYKKHSFDEISKAFSGIIDQSIEFCKNKKEFKDLPNLQETVSEYVEKCCYKPIISIIKQVTKNDRIFLSAISQISLNVLSTPLYLENNDSAFSLKTVIDYERRIDKAVLLIKEISKRKLHREKCELLLKVLKCLSADEFLDADTLLSLLILCLCRSDSHSLYEQLIYLQHFSIYEETVSFGPAAYAISTYAGALSFIEQSLRDEGGILTICECVYSFWEIVKGGQLDDLKMFLDRNKVITDVEFLVKTRTFKGESFISLCSQNLEYGGDIFTWVYESNPEFFALEDILEDRDKDNRTLLLQSLKYENTKMTEIIMNLLCENCTKMEMSVFINATENSTNRTCGHYFGFDLNGLKKVGLLLDWDIKDNLGYTPLFSLLRSYDHPQYEILVDISLRLCISSYSLKHLSFDFYYHVDKKGNSLLHILKSNLKEVLQLKNIDVNARNSSGMTPLMVFSKYNRVQNIRDIVTDDRVMLHARVDSPKKYIGMSCFDFVKSPVIMDILGRNIIPFKDMERKPVFLSLRLEGTTWVLSMSLKGNNREVLVTKHSLKCFKAFVFLHKKKYKYSFLSHDIILNNIPISTEKSEMLLGDFRKLQINKIFSYWDKIVFGICLNDKDFLDGLLLNDHQMVKYLKQKVNEVDAQKSVRHVPSAKYKLMNNEEVLSIKMFLRFAINELHNLKKEVSILKKLLIFYPLKMKDIVESDYILLKKIMEPLYGKIFDSTFETLKTDILKLHDYPFSESILAVNFFYICIEKLITKIQKSTTTTIQSWFLLHVEYLENEKQYNRSNPDYKKSGGQVWPTMVEDYLEENRQMYKNKAYISLKNAFEKLRTIDTQLRNEHVNLAEEINNFMASKNTFLFSTVIVDISKKMLVSQKGKLLKLKQIKDRIGKL